MRKEFGGHDEKKGALNGQTRNEKRIFRRACRIRHDGRPCLQENISGPVCDGQARWAERACGRRGVVEDDLGATAQANHRRSEEHTSELQSLMRISYAVFCLKKKKKTKTK